MYSPARTFPLILTLLLPLLMGLRPVDSVEGTTTPPGLLQIEWGALTWQIQGNQTALTMPQVALRLGLTPRLEIGGVGLYKFQGDAGQAPWDQDARAGQLGLYAKYQILQGLLEDGHLEGVAASLQAGASLLTHTATWSSYLRLAGTLGIGPVMTHLNLGFQYDGYARVLLGAVLLVPLPRGFTPVCEVSGQVRFAEPAAASVLLGVTKALRSAPIVLDVGVRRALAAGSPDWTVTVGLTATLRLWRPMPESAPAP